MVTKRIFISYSRKDKEWKNSLIPHLKPLEMKLVVWDDSLIGVGKNWFSEIEKAINSADAAILLISNNFLKSRFILREEVPVFLQRWKCNEMEIFPLIVGDCNLNEIPWLKSIQAFPRDGNFLARCQKQELVNILSIFASQIEEALDLKNQLNIQKFLEKIINLNVEKGFIDPPFSRIENQKGDKKAKYPSIEMLKSWTRDENPKKIVVFGDSGTGKTTLVKHLVTNTAKEYLNGNQKLRIPIYLDLKEWLKDDSIEQVLAEKSNEFDLSWLNQSEWRKLLDKGSLLLALDGFDEMCGISSRQSIATNISKILNIKSLEENILIVTCRTNFFLERVDENRFFGFEKTYLEPWKEEHIKKYLVVEKEDKANEYWGRLKSIYNLEELCQTPIFLNLALINLAEIERANAGKKLKPQKITSLELYEAHCDKWLHAQALKRDAGLIRVKEKIEILEEFAYKMLYKGDAIRYDELITEIKRLEHPPEKPEDLVNDMITYSLLVRKNNEFIFSHYSFLEFFVARKYFKELKARVIIDFGKVYFKEEIFKFLSEMIHREGNIGDVHYLAENAEGHRPRIHCILLLGRLKEIEALEPESISESERVLEDIVNNDFSLRVAGHAAEILYTKFNNTEGFKNLKSRSTVKYKSPGIIRKILSIIRSAPGIIRKAPKEPNVGWYLDERRNFTLDDTTYVEFFIEIFRRPEKDDENLWWFSLSILSRIKNVSEHFTKDDQARLMEIAKVHKNRSIRAYAATILGKLATPGDEEVIKVLDYIIANDEDDGVKIAASRAKTKLLSK